MPSGLRVIAPVVAAVVAAGGGATWLAVKDKPADQQETVRQLTIQPAPGDDIALSADSGDENAPPTSQQPPQGQPLRPMDRLSEDAAGGEYYAMSGTAMSITGDVNFTGDVISFSNGQTVTTRLVKMLPATDIYSSEGESWADLLYVPQPTRVQLREVIGIAINNGAQSLCGAQKVTWIGLASKAEDGEVPKAVSMALLTGTDLPGPDAPGNNVCATYSYTG